MTDAVATGEAAVTTRSMTGEEASLLDETRLGPYDLV